MNCGAAYWLLPIISFCAVYLTVKWGDRIADNRKSSVYTRELEAKLTKAHMEIRKHNPEYFF